MARIEWSCRGERKVVLFSLNKQPMYGGGTDVSIAEVGGQEVILKDHFLVWRENKATANREAKDMVGRCDLCLNQPERPCTLGVRHPTVTI